MNPRSWLIKLIAIGATASGLALTPAIAGAASAPHKPMAGTVSVAMRNTASAAYCGGAAYAPPGGGYGLASQASEAIIGSPGYKQSYKWTVQGNFSTLVAVQALGFDSNGHSQWYNIGLPSFSGGSGFAPWGSVLAYPELRAESGTGNGVIVTWTC